MPSTNPFDDMSDEGGSIDPLDTGMINVNANQAMNNPPKFQKSSSSSFNNSLPEDMNMNTHNFSSDPDLDYHMPVEASWQFLGELPYRRVPVFRHVSWHKGLQKDNEDNQHIIGNGLAAFPSSWQNVRKDSSTMLTDDDKKKLLRTTTVTKIAGCPNGGPIAAITLPLSTNMNFNSRYNMPTTELRIMMPSGRHLANIEFPPPNLISQYTSRPYSAADVLSIGFTDRTLLIVILRDSLCLTYNLKGQTVLAPFPILKPIMKSTNSNFSSSVEIIEASFFNGGVAVLSETMQTGLVEFFDEHDDPVYIESCHFASKKIDNSMVLPTESQTASYISTSPNYLAIVTTFQTDELARENNFSYRTLAVLPRKHTEFQHPEIFLSTSDNSVIIANSYNLKLTDIDCRRSISAPIISMSFAPNGRFLACFTEDSILTVISTTFETKVLDFDTSEGSSKPPSQMKWCGEDSVILHWKNLGVLMVGPYGDWLRYPYDFTEDLFLIPEIDCCRIITDSSTDIIQRVPPDTAQFLRIGSIEPSAMLLDASDAFESGSPASDEAARAVSRTGLLVDAVETCASAAMREFDVHVQKRLLRAASYGMHFVYKDQLDDRKIMGGEGKVDFREKDNTNQEYEDDNADALSFDSNGVQKNNLSNVRPSPTARVFVAAAKKTRILNALRNPDVGFAMTSAQFDMIKPMGIVARLVEVKRPALATTIAGYLALEKPVQTFARVSRAAAFIASDKGQTDAKTAKAAIQLLHEDILPMTRPTNNSNSNKDNKQPENSSILSSGGYASVAIAAKNCGRPEVAKLLLQLETSIPDKVKGLIAIEAFDGAVSVASDARNADLMFLALLEFQKKCKDSDIDPSKGQDKFFNALIYKCPPEASNLMKLYYSYIKDVQSIIRLDTLAQKHIEAGSFVARRALTQSNITDRTSLLEGASKLYGNGKAQFHKTCTDEYLDLLLEQERLRTGFKAPTIAPESSSVTETLVSIIAYAKEVPASASKVFTEADRLAKKFKVPEKRIWNIKVRTLARTSQWSQLRILADSKAKVPIGFKPFAMAAIKYNQPMGEIMRYMDRVTVPEDRYDLFCEGKLWKRALDEARKLKDHGRVMHIYSLCNSAEIQQMCESVAAQIP